MADLRQRYADKVDGVISCFDRIVIQGTLPQLCYAEGMAGYLNARKIRIFDYPRFAQPFRDRIRENAERIATEHGLENNVELVHELLVADTMRLVGLRAKATLAVGFVVTVVAFEPDYLTVAFEGQHVCCDAVQKPAVVANHDRAAGKT